MFRQYFNKKIVLISAVFFCLGCVVGTFATLFVRAMTRSSQPAYAVREGGYTFINPLLSCNFSEDKQFNAYEPIEDKLKSYVNKHMSSGDAQNISIYFRGLNSGHWSGVNENDLYSPASLLKVPLMIAYLKEADSNPEILDQKITYRQTIDQNSIETFKPKLFIADGKTYSINDLLKYMILYSDNNAASLLQKNVNEESLKEVYSDLGIPISQDDQDETISPKIYSYIFRILYNATYLSKPMSQYALELLTPADFPGGIKAGLPSYIPSAQKFGERTVLKENVDTGQTTLDFRELHDCGIVYYPKNPYLLCVMTKGDDFQKLSGIISNISSIVYNETESGVLKI